MKKKPLVATIAALSLMATPALAQADVADDNPWAAYLVAAGVLAGFVFLAIEDDDDGDEPASP